MKQVFIICLGLSCLSLGGYIAKKELTNSRINVATIPVEQKSAQTITHTKDSDEEKQSKQEQPNIIASTTKDAKVVIGEVSAGSKEDPKNEHIKLINRGKSPVNLTGWSLKKQSRTGKEYLLVSVTRLKGKVIAPSGTLLLAGEGGYKASGSGKISTRPDIFWPKSNTLAPQKNGIALYNAQNKKVDELTWENLPDNTYLERISTEEKIFQVRTLSKKH